MRVSAYVLFALFLVSNREELKMSTNTHYFAEGGKDRRCVYSDGDVEDLSLDDLYELARLDSIAMRKVPSGLDVLGGRGDSICRHPGNKRFREEVKKLRSVYQAAEGYKAKNKLSWVSMPSTNMISP